MSNTRLDHIDRLFQLAQTVSIGSGHAAELVDRVYREAVFSRNPQPDTFSALVDIMESMSFDSGSVPVSTPPPLVDVTRPLPTAPPDRDISPQPDTDDFRRREAERWLLQKAGIYFHALDRRSRFDLWTGIQKDLPERAARAGTILNDLLEALLDDLSDVEAMAFRSELTPDLLRKTIQAYCDSTYEGLPPTLLSVVESRVGLEGDLRRDVRSPASDGRESDRKGRRYFSFRRSLAYGAVIMFAAVAAQWLYQAGQPEPPTRNLLELSIRNRSAMAPEFRTSSPEQAERYIEDRFGENVTIPRISEAQLVGVGKYAFNDADDVPVLVYNDQTSDAEFPVVLFTYAYLQKNRRSIEMPRSVLLRIEEPDAFGVQFGSGSAALIWRVRNDIYAAVVPSNPENLQDRIQPL